MEEPVTIVDRDVLKILSVDTRIDILKILSEGDRTPSDISRRLKKSNSTIVEHLDILCKVGLVKKIEQPGKKWIFYTLTEKGEGVVSSKSRRLVIILGTSLLSGIVGLVGIGKYIFEQGAQFATKEATTLGAERSVSVASQIPWVLYISIALISLSFIGVGFYFVKKLRQRGVMSV